MFKGVNLSDELRYIKKIQKNFKILDLFEHISCEFYKIYI